MKKEQRAISYQPNKELVLGSFVISQAQLWRRQKAVEERFSETVRQFPVIYENGLFSLDTRSLRLRLFFTVALMVSFSSIETRRG